MPKPLNGNKKRRRALLESLEQRVLFSADFVVPDISEYQNSEAETHALDATVTAFETAFTQITPDKAIPDLEPLYQSLATRTEQIELTRSASGLELIFVDSNVNDAETLLSEVHNTASPHNNWLVVTLDKQDTINTITDTLLQYSNVDAIHLISHGSEGLLYIGNTALTIANVEHYFEHFENWNQATHSQTDLLIYGCDLAQTESGRQLVDTIAMHTDLDVAASNDITGHSTLGGDWQLEYHTGDINTAIAFNDATIESWESSLASPEAVTIVSSSDGGLSLNEDGGNNAYLKADNGTQLFSGLQQLTFEVQLSSTGLDSGSTIAHYRTASTDGFKLELDGTNLKLTVNDTSTFASGIDYLSALNDGQHHSITTTWDSATGAWQIYIDGVLSDNGFGSSNTAITNEVGTLVLGQSQGSPDSNFDQSLGLSATLHEARLFNLVRDDYEISRSHSSGVQWSEPNLLASWSFIGLSPNGVVTDSVAGNSLRSLQITEPGFIPSDTSLTLRVVENSPTGTVIGTATGLDPDREAMISAIVASAPDIYHSHDTGSFYQVNDTPELYPDAVTNAQTTPLNGVYGNLLSIYSATENAYIVDIMNSAGISQTHLNATDSAVEGDWRWSDTGHLLWKDSSDWNIPVDGTYSNWGGSNPNDANGQDVAKIFASTGEWDDVKESANFRSVIKYDADAVLGGNGSFGTHHFTYSISNQSIAGTFTIDPNSGEISVADGKNLNYEDRPLHTVEIEVLDSDGNSAKKSFEIAITDTADANLPPTNLSSGIQINSNGGNNAYLEVTDGGQILNGLDALTVDYLVQLESQANSSAQTLLSYTTATQNDALLLQLTPAGSIELTINGDSVSTSENFSEIYNGQLHTLSVTWSSNNGVAFIYVDGQLVIAESGIASGSSLPGNGALVAGNHQTSPGNGYSFDKAMHGTLHDIRIWDRARTHSEIAVNSHSKYADANGLIANWQMDELDSTGAITDEIAGSNLIVKYATGIGFLSSSVKEHLTVKENIASGSSVGFFLPSDQHFFQDSLPDGRLLNESPLPTSTITVSAGNQIGHWYVANGSIDYVAPTILAGPNGSRVIELSGDEAGTLVSNSFSTTPGQTYIASFAADANFSLADVKYKDFIVSAAGQSQHYSVEHLGSDWINGHWERLSFEFTAKDTTTELSFQSLDNSAFGAYIADISVTQTPAEIHELLNEVPDLTYNSNTGKFYKYVDTLVSHDVALDAANTEKINGVSGQLLTIRSQLENELAQKYAQHSGNQIWLGAIRTAPTGTWNWISGTEVSDEQFWSGGSGGNATPGSYASEMGLSAQPTENYLRLDSNGDWYDDTNNGQHSYVVEWDAKSVISNYTFLMTDPSGNFDIEADTGEITVANNHTLDFESADTHTVSVTVTDANNNSYSESIAILVADASSELSQQLPSQQSTVENTPLSFNNANGNIIEVDDDFSTDSQLQVALSVGNGVLQISPTAGVAVVSPPVGSASNLTIEGTESELNNALKNLTYVPDPDYSGTDTLTVTTTTDASLEGRYNFDDDTPADTSHGTMRNGVLTGSATVTAEPGRGSVLELQSTGDGVSILSDFGAPEAISLGGWVNYTGSGQADFLSIDDRLTITIDDAAHNAVTASFVTAGNNTVELTTDISLAGTGWHHVFFVYDAPTGQQTLYIDGEIASRATIPAAIDYTGANTTYIGASPASSGDDYIGKIDDVRVYSRPLSQDEIVGIVNGKDQVTGSIPIDVVKSNSAPYFSVTPPTVNPGAPVPVIGQTDEDIPYTVPVIAVDDIDSGNNDIRAEINVSNGIVNIGNQTGTIVSGANSSTDIIFTGTLNQVNTALSSLTIVPAPDFFGIASIEIDINDQGNTGPGGALNSTDIFNIQVNSVNDAPVLHSGESTTVTYIENDLPVPITTALSISDSDNIQLQSATISITTGLISDEDELLFLPQTGNITGAYNPTTGMLTLNGAASVADYENALRNISYRNTSEDPTAGQIQLSITVNDGAADSNTWQRALQITAVNDAPVINLSGGTTLFAENSDPVVIDNALSLTDVDSLILHGASVTVANYQNGEDSITYINQTGISDQFDTTTGTLTFTGVASIADYQTLLQSMAYQNTSDNPNITPRVVEFAVHDGVDTSITETRIINVQTLNDAPALTSTNSTTLEYTEGGGTRLINSSITITDSDHVEITSAVVQFSSNYVSTEDQLLYTPQAGITGSFNSSTGTLNFTGTSSLSDYQKILRSVSYLNESDAPETLPRIVSFNVNDGVSVSNTVDHIINITPVNNAPLISDIETDTLTINENEAALPISSTIELADPDDQWLTSAMIQISTNYIANEDTLFFNAQSGISGVFDANTGTLHLSGVASVAEYQSALRSVRYLNSSENPDPSTREIQISVFDGTSTSNTQERNLNIVALNDAPEISAIDTSILIYTENDPAAVIAPNIQLSDLDHAQLSAATVSISTNFDSTQDRLLYELPPASGIVADYNSTAGVLSFSGNADISNYQSALRSVSYLNVSDNPSHPGLARIIEFEVSDGVAASNSSRVIELSPENDAPSLFSATNTPLAYPENAGAVLVDASITIQDPDDTVLQGASVQISGNFNSGEDYLSLPSIAGISSSYNASTGLLNLQGAATIEDYQTALQSVSYSNALLNPDTTTRTITFKVFDSQFESNALTRDIDINPENNAPTISNIETGRTVFTENSLPVPISESLVLGDIDNTLLQSASVGINSNFDPVEDSLSFTPQSGISSTFDNVTGQLSLSGSASVGDYEAALRSVTYTNSSDNPSTAIRNLIFTVSDGQHTSNTVARELAVLPVNDAPHLTLNSAPTIQFFENAPSTAIAPALTLVDLDSTTIQSATVSIDTNYATAEDDLVFSHPNLASTYSNGVLTITGPDTVAGYQQALRTVSYQNTSEAPVESIRTVSFSVNDGQSDSVIRTIDLNIEAVNDDPLLTGTETHEQVYSEGSAPVAVTLTTRLNDFDDVELTSASVAIVGNYFAQEDVLLFNGHNGITGQFDSQSGALLLSGVADLTDYETAINSITYQNISEDPTTIARRIEITVFDGKDHSNAGVRYLTVVKINDAPIGSNIELMPIIYNENSLAITITDTFTVSDPDDTLIRSATVAITENFTASEDQLLFNEQFGIAGSYNPVSGELSLTGQASLSQYQDAIRSVRYLNLSENPTTTERTLSITVNDAQQSSAPVSRDLLISDSNDRPLISGLNNNDIVYLESSDEKLLLQTLVLGDPDNETLESATVSISPSLIEDQLLFESQSGITGYYNNAENSLFLSGTASVDQYQAALQSIRYLNTSDAPSDEMRVVSISVNDGINDSLIASRNIVVIEVSDAPDGGDSTVTIGEDTSYTFQTSDFKFNDSKDGDFFASIVISTAPQNGALYLGGELQPLFSTVSISDIVAGRFAFHPNTNTVDSSRFGFLVQDTGSSLNGGQITDTSENFINLEIEPINDAPQLLNNGITVDEGSTTVIETDSLAATDVESPDFDLIFTVLAPPAHGSLTLNGTLLNVDSSFTLAQIVDQTLSYQHDGSGTTDDSFKVTLQDGDDSTPITATINISINEVLDTAPFAVDDNFSIPAGLTLNTSDAAQHISVLDNDLINDQGFSLLLVAEPQHGTLVFNDDGTFIYHHDANSSAATDQFSYQITNEDDISVVATVLITIVPQPEVQPEPEPVISAAQDKLLQPVELTNFTNPLSTQLSISKIEVTNPATEHSDKFKSIQPGEVEQLRTIAVSATEISNIAQDNTRRATIKFSLEALEIVQHNKLDRAIVATTIDLSTIDETASAIDIHLNARDVIDNVNFSRPLTNLINELLQASKQDQKRYDVNTDAAFGVSFSLTAAIIAWTLRGGALLGSIMALQPLWATVNPLQAATKPKSKDPSKEDTELEKLFE